ncbi:MAG: dockerin type I domain-containing protein [Planctomycetota bacterium]
MKTHQTAVALAGILSGTLACHAAGQAPITLTVDESQSVVDIGIQIISPLGNRSDTDNSPFGGSADVRFDDDANPSIFILDDYSFISTETLDYFYDFGLLGTVTAQGVGVGLTYPSTSLPVSTGISPGAGTFILPVIDNQFVGVVNVTSTGLIGDTVGSESFDLSVDTEVDILKNTEGIVTFNGEDVTVTLVVPFQVTQEPALGVEFIIGGTATFVLTGQRDCPGDVNDDGGVSDSDFFAWVTVFLADPRSPAQTQACDVNGDGNCSDSDFFAWVTSFLDGC